MYATKNDLSFNKVELDYEALLYTARVAFGHSLAIISDYAQKLGEDYDNDYGVGLVLNAKWLEKEAHNLTVVCETLSALIGGEKREELEVVNKKPVKLEVEKETNQPKPYFAEDELE